MTRTVRRGKDERTHVRDKQLGTGAFKKINVDRRSKQLKQKNQNERKSNDG